jgi:type VI secretion system lysozyme-like protein
LLNTRREFLEGAPPEYKEVNNSLLMFGLPDFTSYSLLNPEHRKLIRRAVEEALNKFEPRLKSVQVTLESPSKFDAALHFRIDALLRLDPAPEPITFDAALQLGTSSYSVRGEASARDIARILRARTIGSSGNWGKNLLRRIPRWRAGFFWSPINAKIRTLSA